MQKLSRKLQKATAWLLAMGMTLSAIQPTMAYADTETSDPAVEVTSGSDTGSGGYTSIDIQANEDDTSILDVKASNTKDIDQEIRLHLWEFDEGFFEDYEVIKTPNTSVSVSDLNTESELIVDTTDGGTLTLQCISETDDYYLEFTAEAESAYAFSIKFECSDATISVAKVVVEAEMISSDPELDNAGEPVALTIKAPSIITDKKSADANDNDGNNTDEIISNAKNEISTLDDEEHANENTKAFELTRDNITVATETSTSVYRDPTETSDGTQLYYTGETATTTISISNTSNQSSDGYNVRIYFETEDENYSFGLNIGTQQIIHGDDVYSFEVIENENGYYLDLPIPSVGNTISFPVTMSFATGTAGGTVTVESEIIKGEDAVKSNEQQILKWETIIDNYPVTKTLSNDPSFIGNSENDDYAYLSEMDYEIKIVRSGTTLGTIGNNPIASATFTDTMTLPAGLSFSDNLSVRCTKNTVTIQSVEISEDNKVVTVTGAIENIDSDDFSFTLCFDEKSIKTDGPASSGDQFNITNKIEINENFTFTDDVQHESASTSNTITVGESDITLTKNIISEASGYNVIQYLGEDTRYYITASNTGISSMKLGDITDTLPLCYYIPPEDMEKMFDGDYGDYLTLTITNATITTEDTDLTVTGVDGNQYKTSISNTWSGTIYDGLSQPNPDSYINDYALSNGATISFVKGNNCIIMNYNSNLYTIGENGYYDSIEDALNAINFKVTYYTQYNAYWDMDSADTVIYGGETKTFDIYCNVKDSFMLLTKDAMSRYNYEYNYYVGDLPTFSKEQMTNTATLYKPNEKIPYKTASVPNFSVRMDFNVSKSFYIDGKAISDGDSVKSGVAECRIIVSKQGLTKYDIIPLVEQMTGDQVLLVSVDENNNIDWNKQLDTYEYNGNEYYILTEGVYKNVVVNEFLADRVEVINNNGELVTRIYWYLTGGCSVSYNALFTAQYNENAAGYGKNSTWLGDYQGHRLYADFRTEHITIDKNIVNEIGDTETECKSSTINNGETVIYRLTIQNLGDTPINLDGSVMTDLLPLSTEDYRWSTDNVSISYSDYLSITSPDKWIITDAQDESNQQMIQWSKDFTMSVDDTAYIWVTLKYPENSRDSNDWALYCEHYSTTVLSNTFKLDWNANHSATVTHQLSVDAKAILQKGIVETGCNYYANPTGGGFSYSYNTEYNSRWTYSSTLTNSNNNLVRYYVVLYNDGISNLYLSDITDVLPAGFDFLDVRQNTTYSDVSNSSGQEVIRKSATVTAEEVRKNNSDTVTFTIANSTTANNLNYDEGLEKYYLAPGEMLEFSYYVYTEAPSICQDEALNTIAMPYYSIDGSNITLSDSNISIADKSMMPNDGSVSLLNNNEAKEKGLTSGDADTKWLESEVTIYKGDIKPGVSKKAYSSTNSNTGDIAYDPITISPSDIITWEVTVQNDGTDAITDYYISDKIPYPYTLAEGSTIDFHISNGFSSVGSFDLSSMTIKDLITNSDGKVTAFVIEWDQSRTSTTSATFEVGTTYQINTLWNLSRRNQPNNPSKNVYPLSILFEYDEDDNLCMNIRIANDSLSIPHDGSLTLTYSTQNTNNIITNQTFVNDAYFTPMLQNWNGSTNIGEYVETGITKDTNGMPSVHNIALITMTNGYGTTSNKSVTETTDTENTTSSNNVKNYIVLDNSTDYFNYSLTVNNISEYAMDKLILIDNLPEIGDHETFDTSSKRNSEFKIGLADAPDFTVTVLPNDTSTGDEAFTLNQDQYIIQYSAKTEFTSDDWDGNGDGWITYTDGADISNARSIRLIILDDSGTLIPTKSSVSLDFSAHIDGENVSPGAYAWNTFGYTYSVYGSSTDLQATPMKVGVAIAGKPIISKSTIDEDGNPIASKEDVTYHYILYKGNNITGINEASTIDDVITALNDAETEFSYIELTVPAGKTVSDQLSLADIYTYDYSNTDGFIETDAPWIWEIDASYTLWEIPGENYTFDNVNDTEVINNTYTFTYTNTRNQTLDCVNKVAPDTFDIRVNKYYDETVGGTTYTGTVEGAVLQVWNADKSEMLAEQTVDETGYVTFTELAAGDYVLVEADAPDHFIIADDIEFTVNEDGTITTEDTENVGTDDSGMYLKMKDEMEDGTVTIQKYEDDGETPLAGVTYTLYDFDDQAVSTITTGEDGKATFTDIPFGDYTIVETETAEGYSLLAEPISVTIPLIMTAEEAQANDADTTQAFYDEATDSYIFFALTYSVTDDATFVLPTTGSNNLAVLGLGSMGVLIILADVWFTYRRKKGSKPQKIS